MFVVTQDTLRNPGVLETRSLPKKFLGRVTIYPRDAGWRTVARLTFEIQPLRYIVALLPFVVAMFVWPRLALPLAQAPLAMILVIALVETKALQYSETARAALVTEAEAARVLDLLAFRARGLLPGIAARHDMDRGRLHLVVEQSEAARITPLTLVTVQAEDPPRVLALTKQDRAELETLFDKELTETALHKVNAQSQKYLRDVAFDVRGVSATSRMAARIKAREVAA